MKQFSKTFKIIAGTVALIAVCSVAFTSSDLYRKIAKSQRLINEAYKYLITNYVDQLDTDVYTSTTLRNLMSELDPYTVYLEENERDGIELLSKGQYGGVGIQLSRRNKELTVIAPMDDTPAQRSGIISGDVIRKIDEQNADELSLDEAAKLIRGIKGTVVKLTIERYGTDGKIEFNLTRADIHVNDVTYAGMINESTGYIRLTRFSKNAAKEMKEALRSLEKENAAEIILDLRDNPGGLLAAAIDIMDLFVPKGELLLTTKGRTKESTKTYHSRRPISVSRNVKIAVLINQGSASASEIVAGAFQDLDRGIVIGQRSFGKGLVQSVYSLDPTKSLKITTAKYYIPSGRLVQKPDYIDEEIILQSAEEDSIFYTKGGRTVKGGGGIHPDFTVEEEDLPPLTLECWRKGLFFTYAQKHKHLYRSFDHLKNDENLLTDFKSFLAAEEIDVALPGENQFREAWEKLEEYTNDNKKLHVAFSKAEEVIIESENALFANEIVELERGLLLEFASLFNGTSSRIKESLKYDLVVQKAVGILSDQVAYNGTFTVEN